ncbi:MAG: hypothetical protein J5818_02385 [Eggerthellaceae bacterium]|nr:hypothetical protein [Eggerthellaceae bacterium]
MFERHGYKPSMASSAIAALLALTALFVAVLCLGLGAPAHAYGATMTSDGFPADYDDEVAMRDYDRNIWCDYADLSWYEGHESDTSFTLSTPEELAGLAVLVTKYGVTFSGATIQLVSDIDLDGHQWFPIGCNEATYWYLSPFMGTFDGGGHTIRNLYIENGFHGQALFGECQDAVIKNLTVYGDVTTGWQAAGIVAEMGRTTLQNITSYVNVTTLFKSGDGGYASTAGGIVAYVADTYVVRTGTKPSRLENLVNYGIVVCGGITEQGGGVGGIAGSLLVADDDQTIVVSQCENHGTVVAEASNYVDIYVKGCGGIVGSTATYGNYQITDCSNTGEVSAANLPSTGGVVGSISGLASSVEYCYNSGSVVGSSPEDVASTGGIVGRHVASHTGNTSFDVTSCYNVGDVKGNGKNVSAILGSTSGFAEDWVGVNNDGGTTVHNNSNYYLDGSVQTSSQTGVLFQSGTIEAGQEVSMNKINSKEVIDALNSTDQANDHYVAGDASPRLELRGATDIGVDKTSTEGEGADDAVLSDADNATQRETHMYAIRTEQVPDTSKVGTAIDWSVLMAGIALMAFALLGLALQGLDFRNQTRPLKAVVQPRKG